MGLSVKPGGNSPWPRVLRVDLPVLSYFTILTILLTYPLILNFKTYFPGDGGDGYMYVWHFWFFKKQVLQLKNPFFTTDMFYPVGTTLLFTSYTLVNDVLAAGLSFLIPNLVVVSNGLYLLAFVLSGYCAFLLVDYLTQNKWAALLGGTIFAFCPAHTIRLLGHFDLTLTHWIPLFILFFLKTVDPKGTYRQAVITGIIAALTLVDTSYYYVVFLIIFVALFYLYQLSDRERRAKYLGWASLKRAIVIGGMTLLLTAPILALAYKYARAGFYESVEGWMGANTYVADVVSFLVPSYIHPFWGDRVTPYYFQRLNNTIEGVVFVGWLVISLTGIAALYLARRQPELRLWRFVLVAFGILSLGPTLHIMGASVKDFGEFSVSVPLPFIAIHYIPVIQHLRSPSRLTVMCMLAAAVLCGYVWVWLQGKMKGHRVAGGVVFALIMLITLGEYLCTPFPLCSAKIPGVFYKIAADKNPGTVMEIPFTLTDGKIGRGNCEMSPFLLYTQMAHGRKRIAGYTSRGAQRAVDYYEEFPVIHTLLDLEESYEKIYEELDQKLITATPEEASQLTDAANQKIAELMQQADEHVESAKQSAPELVKQVSLRYIIIHPRFRDKPSHYFLTKVFSLGEPTYEDEEGYLAYQISEAAVAPAPPAEDSASEADMNVEARAER